MRLQNSSGVGDSRTLCFTYVFPFERRCKPCCLSRSTSASDRLCSVVLHIVPGPLIPKKLNLPVSDFPQADSMANCDAIPAAAGGAAPSLQYALYTSPETLS